jgi:hypothetical protein
MELPVVASENLEKRFKLFLEGQPAQWLMQADSELNHARPAIRTRASKTGQVGGANC